MLSYEACVNLTICNETSKEHEAIVKCLENTTDDYSILHFDEYDIILTKQCIQNSKLLDYLFGRMKKDTEYVTTIKGYDVFWTKNRDLLQNIINTNTDTIIKKLNDDIERLANKVDSIIKSVHNDKEEMHIDIIRQLSAKAKEMKDGEEAQDKIHNMVYSIKNIGTKYYIIVLEYDKPFVDVLDTVGKRLFGILDQVIYTVDKDKLI